MFKEGAYAEQGKEESIEHEGLFPKETLKRILESRHSINDFGRSGILFRIGPEDLSPEERATIALTEGGNEENPEGALSIKALKVFDLELAKREFEALQEARRIMVENNEQSSSSMIARIPRAFGFDEIEVDAATQELLNANGGTIKDGKVGIITMDWIEGKDLAMALKEELLKLTSDSDDGYQGQEKDLNNANFGELLRLLEKKGFVLPEAIITQIKNTVDTLHKNKFYHNDLHLRNVILKDGDFEDPQMYMIDFADAGHEKRTIENADGEYFLSDENIIKSLAPLTTPLEAKEKQLQAAVQKEWEERVSIVENQPKAVEQYATIKNGLDAHFENTLDIQFAVSSGTDSNLENFMGNLLRLAREEGPYRDIIKTFVESFVNEKKPKTKSHFVISRMSSLLKAIEN